MPKYTFKFTTETGHESWHAPYEATKILKNDDDAVEAAKKQSKHLIGKKLSSGGITVRKSDGAGSFTVVHFRRGDVISQEIFDKYRKNPAPGPAERSAKFHRLREPLLKKLKVAKHKGDDELAATLSRKIQKLDRMFYAPRTVKRRNPEDTNHSPANFGRDNWRKILYKRDGDVWFIEVDGVRQPGTFKTMSAVLRRIARIREGLGDGNLRVNPGESSKEIEGRRLATENADNLRRQVRTSDRFQASHYMNQMIKALQLHSWNNTVEDWKRLYEAKIIQAERRKTRRK